MEIISQLTLNSIIAGAIYTLMALGFNLIYGVVKFFNLAHGVVAVIGGYTVFLLTGALGLNLYLSVAAGVFFAGLAGYGFDKLVFLPLRRRKTSSMVLLVASLGVFTSAQAIIAIFFTSEFRTLGAVSAGENIYSFSGGVITQTQLVILISGMLIMLGLTTVLNRTIFGKAIKAINDDAEVARIVGIDTDRITGRVFFIGSAIAGFAGILVGFDTGIQPTMGMGLLLKGVIASIIGGVGNIYGGVLGSFLLGFVENFGIWKVPGEWKEAIAFFLLILFLLVRPEGIMKR